MSARATPDLAVAICTRNRLDTLKVSVRSLVDDVKTANIQAEFIIIDDGEILDAEVANLRTIVKNAGAGFLYKRKPADQRGLYLSRKLAVATARAPLILFADDDIEVSPGYISKLVDAFSHDPSLAGIGGVDRESLPCGNGRVGELIARIFLLGSGNPGLLSATSMNYSQSLWRLQQKAFDSEFLHGCNMAFRSSALLGLPPLPWLTGHAPCEDLVLSQFARRSGRLLVDPDLAVYHHLAPSGRDGASRRIAIRIVNTARFDEWRRAASRARPVFFWSVLGLAVKDVVKAVKTRQPVSEVLNGVMDGLREILTRPIPATKELSA